MRLPVLALTLVALTLLTACGPAPGRFRPEATVAPMDAPLFESDAEALAAAEEVYREYLRVVGKVMDGEVAFTELEDLLAGEALDTEKSSVDEFRALGAISTGEHTIVTFELQALQLQRRPSWISVYVCEDVSAVEVRDIHGNSLVSSSRPPRSLLLVEFEARNDSDLVIVSRDVWSDAC